MAQANANSTSRASSTTSRSQAKTRTDEGLSKVRSDAVAYVRQTTERAVDLPVGVALETAERVTGLVQPWTASTTRDRELKSLRRRVERELNRYERRGSSARRKARQRVRETRNRFERELKQRRRSVETSVRESRKTVETRITGSRERAQASLKKAQDAVATLV